MPVKPVQADSPPAGQYLGEVLRELQGIKTAVVAGAAANTDIAVAGIATEDTIIAVTEHAAPEEAAGIAAAFDRTAQTTIPSNGNIRVSVATNTNAQRRLHVLYFDRSGP